MKGCYLSIDFEDFSHDLQRALGIKKPQTRKNALMFSIQRIMETIKNSPGSNEVTLSNDPTAHAEIVTIRKAC